MRHRRSILLRLTMAAILVSVLLCLFFASNRLAITHAQVAERVVTRFKFTNAPVDLTAIEVAGQPLLDQEKLTNSQSWVDQKELKFNAQNEWLRDLKVKFKNVSAKPIIAMRTNLLISHPSLQTPWMISLAPSRRVPLFRSDSDTSWEVLRPNEEISYSANAPTVDQIDAELKSNGATGGISRVELRVSFVTFDDGTGWGYGANFRRDPNKPDAWLPHKKVASTKGEKGLFIKASYSTNKPTRSLLGCYAEDNYPHVWDCAGAPSCHFEELRVDTTKSGRYDEVFVRIPRVDQQGFENCGANDYGYNLLTNPYCPG